VYIKINVIFIFTELIIFLGGWIHGLAFNKTGNRLCWVAHDSSITIADVSKGSIVVNKLKTKIPCLSFEMNLSKCKIIIFVYIIYDFIFKKRTIPFT